MFDMLGKLGEIKSSLEKAKKEIAEMSVTITAEELDITVTATGDKRVSSITFSEDARNADTFNTVLIKTINKALEEAEAQGQEKMKSITAGVLPDVSGLM